MNNVLDSSEFYLSLRHQFRLTRRPKPDDLSFLVKSPGLFNVNIQVSQVIRTTVLLPDQILLAPMFLWCQIKYRVQNRTIWVKPFRPCLHGCVVNENDGGFCADLYFCPARIVYKLQRNVTILNIVQRPFELFSLKLMRDFFG